MPEKVFESVIKAERRTEEILNNAQKEATRIEREAELKSHEVYEETYKKIIDEARRDASKIVEQGKIETEKEVQQMLRDMGDAIKNLRAVAEKKMDNVVKLCFQILTKV